MSGHANDRGRGRSSGDLHSDARDLAPTESSRVTRPPAALPPHRLEALLTLATRLRADQGTRELCRDFVRGMARQLPGLGVAVVVPRVGVVEGVEPSGASLGAEASPTRPFPQLPYERVVPIGTHATTLRLGSDGPETAEEEHFLLRAADLLESFLEQARTFEAIERHERDLADLRSRVIQTEKLAALGQLAAGIMHELNNPLTSIVAYADQLQRNSDSLPPESSERLARIEEAAERVLDLSRDVVGYARPAGSIPAPVPVAQVVNRALSFCEHELSECSITVDVHVPASGLLVSGFSGPLTQVFVNLFTNAAHAMRERGGTLRVRATRTKQTIIVDVSDDGVGMESNELTRIFEPFYTTKESGRGSGLGLFIVRNIIDAHGGLLEPTSTPGVGTTFRITLPPAADPE